MSLPAALASFVKLDPFVWELLANNRKKKPSFIWGNSKTCKERFFSISLFLIIPRNWKTFVNSTPTYTYSVYLHKVRCFKCFAIFAPPPSCRFVKIAGCNMFVCFLQKVFVFVPPPPANRGCHFRKIPFRSQSMFGTSNTMYQTSRCSRQ